MLKNVFLFKKTIPVNLSRIKLVQPAFPVLSHFAALPTGCIKRNRKDDQRAMACSEIASKGKNAREVSA